MAVIETSLEGWNMPTTGTGNAYFPWYCVPRQEIDVIFLKVWPDGVQAYPGLSTNQMLVAFHNSSPNDKSMGIFFAGSVVRSERATIEKPVSWLPLQKQPNGDANHLNFSGGRSGNIYSSDFFNFWRVFGGKRIVFDWATANDPWLRRNQLAYLTSKVMDWGRNVLSTKS